jgi:hypothetical protein
MRWRRRNGEPPRRAQRASADVTPYNWRRRNPTPGLATAATWRCRWPRAIGADRLSRRVSRRVCLAMLVLGFRALSHLRGHLFGLSRRVSRRPCSDVTWLFGAAAPNKLARRHTRRGHMRWRRRKGEPPRRAQRACLAMLVLGFRALSHLRGHLFGLSRRVSRRACSDVTWLFGAAAPNKLARRHTRRGHIRWRRRKGEPPRRAQRASADVTPYNWKRRNPTRGRMKDILSILFILSRRVPAAPTCSTRGQAICADATPCNCKSGRVCSTLTG